MIEYRGCCPSGQARGGPQYQEYITELADQKYGDHIVIERWHEMIYTLHCKLISNFEFSVLCLCSVVYITYTVKEKLLILNTGT
jgi:hypothetical protein